MTIMEAVERLSGRKLETMPTPGRRLQTRADCGPHRPAQWTWLPPDPSRPVLVPGEHERAFAEIMQACSSGAIELRYRHSDDPLQLRPADYEGLSPKNFDALKSELVFGDERFPAVLVPLEQGDSEWWSLGQVVAWVRRSFADATVRQIHAALESACACDEIRARGRRRVYITDRPLPISHLDPEFVRFADSDGELQPWPEAIPAREWPNLTFFARSRWLTGEQYHDGMERALDELGSSVELRSTLLHRLAWMDVEFLRHDAISKWPAPESADGAFDLRRSPEPSNTPAALGAQQAAARHRGPRPGTVDRYRDSDRALYREVERLMQDEHLSCTAAAMKLAEARRVAGIGSAESRARRLAQRFAREQGEEN